MLYGDSCTHLDKTDTPKFKGNIFEKAAKKIYENKEFKTEDLAFDEAAAVINETYRILKNAISSSITHEVPKEVIYALENNAFTFSGFKTFHSLKEVGLSLIGKDGKIVQFNDFTQQVQAINDKYNRNYLYAEYNHAVGASIMAAKWTEFEQSGDRYNLQYRTAGDGRVREKHAVLNGTTLPASDAFWNRFLPPNGWNCRCNVVQVRKNKYPTSDSELANKQGEECTKGAKNAIFRYNSGKTLELFPPKHPYYKASKKDKEILEPILEEIKSAEDVVSFINSDSRRARWFERGFSKLIETKRGDVNGFTDLNGLIALTPERMKGLMTGVNKIRRNAEISKDEADAVATFWHEVTHNRSVPGFTNMNPVQRRFMELANEFVARKTLPEFYEGIGGKMQHREFMNNRESTGYNVMVCGYDTIIKETKADTGKVLESVKTHLFNSAYDKQKNGLVHALSTAGAKKKNGEKLTKKEIGQLVEACRIGETTLKNMLRLLVED